MKASPLDIIVAHYRTYVNDDTGSPSWQDHALFEGLPVALLVACLWFEISIPNAASVGLLTVAGLLSAFLFGAMLQVSQRAMDWADAKPPPGEDTTDHAEFLSQLAANAGYSSLVSIVTATVFAVAAVTTSHEAAVVFTALGLGFALHMVMVLSMVMSRVFALTEERLIRAQTDGGGVTQLRRRKKRAA
jgi:hypothetical protein